MPSMSLVSDTSLTVASLESVKFGVPLGIRCLANAGSGHSSTPIATHYTPALGP
jgi:hypothetical protein